LHAEQALVVKPPVMQFTSFNWQDVAEAKVYPVLHSLHVATGLHVLQFVGVHKVHVFGVVNKYPSAHPVQAAAPPGALRQFASFAAHVLVPVNTLPATHVAHPVTAAVVQVRQLGSHAPQVGAPKKPTLHAEHVAVAAPVAPSQASQPALVA
jgi:hypothetical protein